MKPGQEVVCTKKGNWVTIFGPDPVNTGPKYNEIVTIQEVRRDQDGGWEFLILEEYESKYGYSSRHFQPVLSQEQIAGALNEICEVVLV